MENETPSAYMLKHEMLKGKIVIREGIKLSQSQKCVLLHQMDHVEIQMIAADRKPGYTIEDKPGWLNGNCVSANQYSDYLNLMHP